MVFESLVADLLNKYLGDYVANLDRSQLKIGIWGGDVVLNNLSLKQNALDDLQLPVKTVNGFLGKLTLKIPWTNLYNAPVEASIEDLFLLVVPNTEVKYDQEREEKWKQEAKQAEIAKVEEAKKQEREKDKPKPDDTFTEKLATQIVRNVQVSIKNIHVRYEDRVNTAPGRPFALGVTLASLAVTTTDKDWVPRITQDAVAMIYKILSIEGLSVYWNSRTSKSFLQLPQPDLLAAFREGIAGKEVLARGYQYMLGPINTTSKLRLNTKPESDGTDFKTPKVLLNLELERLQVKIGKTQYRDVMVLLDSIDRMSRGAPYRKYRPALNAYKGNYKHWWRFAYTCVLEEEVRRRRRNWQWAHISAYRHTCRRYAKVHQQRVLSAKPALDVVANCENCERQLDVLNIILIRQRIEVEVERKGLLEKQKQKSSGWFSGWWGGGQQEDDKDKTDIRKQFEDAMTPGEKEKLFRAIGYQENTAPAQYPLTFVAVDLNFMLHSLQVEVSDETSQVLTGSIDCVSARCEQRPAGQAVRLTVKMEQFVISGFKQGEITPQLVQTLSPTALSLGPDTPTGDSAPLLDVVIEVNPLDGTCDQRVHVTSRPLRINYDAETVNRIIDVFTAPQTAVITQLQTAANLQLEAIKEKSALGLQYAIQKHTRLDLKVDLMGFYGILPHGGLLTGESQCVVVVNLGRVVVSSVARSGDEANVQSMHKQGTTDMDIMQEMMSRSYDRFTVQLCDAQVRVVLPGDQWSVAAAGNPDEYLLKPTSLQLDLAKCLFTDDPRLPKFKVALKLPSISLRVAETRLLNLIALLVSIPVPEAKEEEDPDSALQMFASQQSLTYLDIARAAKAVEPKKAVPQQQDELVQFIEVEAKFELKEVSVSLFRKTGSGEGEGDEKPLAQFDVLRLEADMTQMTYDLTIDARLGGLSLVHDFEGERVQVINTPMADGQREEYLFTVKLCKVSKDSPEFHWKHGSVVHHLRLDFSRLNVLVHQEALLDALQWASSVQTFLTDATQKKVARQSRPPTPSKPSQLRPSTTTRILSSIREEATAKQAKKKSTALVAPVDTVDLKVGAQLGEISVTIRNSLRPIGALYVKGGDANVVMKRSYTQVDAKLSDLEFIDLRSNTKHPKVLSILGSEQALTTQLVMYNADLSGSGEPNAINMSVTANLARFKIVFLNYFVMSLLDFLSQFSAAQEAILEASAAAAEAAKVNMQQAYNEAFRIRLNILLKAPIIVVPAHSLSDEAVLVDLGVLSLINTFQELHTEKDGRQLTAVIDHLHLGLENLKVSRVKLDSSLEVAEESLILQPISCQLSVQRNLCADWFTDRADLDVGGRLESIHVTLNQEDYNMIMRVVSQNLGETPEPPTIGAVRSASASQVQIPATRKPTSADAAVKPKKSSISIPSIMLEEEKNPEKVRTNVKFAFTMESLVVDLYKGGAKESGLVRFTLQVLSLKGSLLSDSALSVSLRLLDCLSEDTRPGTKAAICRQMERKPLKATDQPRSMVDITYQQKGAESFVDMRVFSFILILNIEHLLSIAAFFTAGLDQPPPPRPVRPTINASLVTATSSKSEVAVAVAAVAVPDKTMTVSVLVEQPDIILVERLDDINASAIIMNIEMSLKLRMRDSHQVINGSMSNLQLFSCCFNPERRAETKAQILRPVSVNVAGSTPSDQGLHLDISTTNIRLSVTPGTIELLTRVTMAVTAAQLSDQSADDAEADYTTLWQQRPFNANDYWFLKTEIGLEADSSYPPQAEASPSPSVSLQEVCLCRVPALVITVEAGVGNKTLPMLLLESSLQATVRNWSSNLSVDGSLPLQVSYYNSRLALWEPLLEPVASGNGYYTPWELALQVEMNNPKSLDCVDTPDGVAVLNAKPKMAINISSKETMELTVTKTCLEVLQNLGVAFNNAIFKPESRPGGSGTSAPYLVQNDLGMIVTVVLANSPFKIFDPEGVKGEGVTEVVLEMGAKVELCLVEEEEVQSMVGQKASVREKFLLVKVGSQCELELPVARADKRFFFLQQRSAGGDPWGLVSAVTVQDGATIITLRTILQIHNHFNVPIGVYFMTRKSNEVELVGEVQPQKQLNLPLHSVYTNTNELFFGIDGFTVSIAPFIWKDLQTNLVMTKILQCNAKNVEDKEPFFMKVVGELEQVYNELSTRHTMASTCYNIHLRPTVVLKNWLPVDALVCTQGEAAERRLPAGGTMQVPTAQPGASSIVIRLSGYLEKEWSCKHEIAASPPELSVWTFQSYDSAQRITLDLGMLCVDHHGSLQFALYCPFWMINKTGMMLSYRKSSKPGREDNGAIAAEQSDDSSNVLYHPPHFRGPVMFSFRAKSFFGKKKACVKLAKGEWSDKFSLDVAGSSGVVRCRVDNVNHQVGVHIQLTYNSLTKQVTFTPYHVLINQCAVPIEVQELCRPADPWTKVGAGEVSAFWPQTNQPELVLRLADTAERTIPFLYDNTMHSLLKLHNKYGAVDVDVQVTEGATYMTFRTYVPGMAPALVVNDCSQPIPIKEKNATGPGVTLEPGHQMFFTWSSTKEDSRSLVWCNSYSSDLRKDETGEFSAGNRPLRWVTLLDGLQRILLLTSDHSLANEVQAAGKLEVFDQELCVSVHGVGLSLVDDIARQEVLYVGITSSGTIWETCKTDGRKWKALSMADTALLEAAHDKFLQETSFGHCPNAKVAIADNLVVDLDAWEMLRPQHRKLRRTYHTGLWLVQRQAAHQKHIHFKINRLQVDNQTHDSIFPVVFAPVPPPRSVSADNALKPFAEVSVVQRINEHSSVQQFKYLKVLIQEFHLKVDTKFINALVKMFEAGETSEEQEAELFAKDCSVVDESLVAHVALLSSQDQLNFYDHLHLSPLKIHITFTISGDSQSSDLPTVLNVMMQTIGVAITEIQDVVFKLSYFERNFRFMSQKQVMNEAVAQYKGQLLKQFYVLVLGLDVLGNPFGLVIGIKDGVQDLFYEPFQGAIQGPGEFAEGLYLGVRSLLGHTVGGAAGAVSRITGTIGKGVAALTFDDDYQRKRREALQHRPTNVQEGLAQGGKGLVMGVVEGVGGVFTKPISGAREDGVGGFFKGLGKGAVGLVARPASGVIDFASGTFSTVKRAAELGEEVTRLRQPRHFHADGLVRPYNRCEADGNKLLRELEKGKYYVTDEYEYHTECGPKGGRGDVLLLTDKRLMILSHNDIFGGNQVELSYTWGELREPPCAVPKGVQLKVGEHKKTFFHSNDGTKVILLSNDNQKKFVVEKIQLLMNPRTGTTSRQNTL